MKVTMYKDKRHNVHLYVPLDLYRRVKKRAGKRSLTTIVVEALTEWLEVKRGR